MTSTLPRPARLERLPRFAWGVIAVLVLTVMYSVIQIAMVRPYLWPAGTGARLAGDPATRSPLRARPPDGATELGHALVVIDVVPDSPAARNGVAAGDLVTAIRDPSSGAAIRFATDESGMPIDRLDAWRRMYRFGVRGSVAWTIRSRTGVEREVLLDRTPPWSSSSRAWIREHVGAILKIIVFTGGALLLLFLRSNDLTAGLAVLALALIAVGSGGPLLGAEATLPLWRVLTVFAWSATAFAFPVVALAILYFPTRSSLLVRQRWLHVVPFVVAAPMIVPGFMTALYLAGLDAARPIALWDTFHPGVYYGSFAAALVINVLAIVEELHRYNHNRDANERRRVRVAVYTAVPGIAAFAVKEGVPIVARLAGGDAPQYPFASLVFLQTLVLLPVFGLVYAVGVERALGPRVVLRRSLQYALASRTLTLAAILPAAALTATLIRDRGRTIVEIATGSSALYLLLIAASVAAFHYRERARQWLDQKFFREEYDARKILLSLASRVRFETDPADLASMVVSQIDEALHPTMVAILVSGVEDGRLTPVTVLHGSAESLPLDGGLIAMLRWSDEPLEIFLDDPRSPARRLPEAEQEWLQCADAVLLVPVIGEDRSLIAAIVLGERRSEAAYTTEDRQLLGSIAAQMGLGFDVARLRRRAELQSGGEGATTRLVAPPIQPMMECPRCGRCEEAGVTSCPNDGSKLMPVLSVPKIVDNKYRIEQLLGRGGMGAVYRARDMRLDRLVALKVVRAELLADAEARQRFRREAQIVARLQHPSIVAVFDYGTFADGGAYLVMELVRGEDLRRMLQREGRLDTDRAIRILNSVCAAIDTAHREGVLHRDLKPENILLPGGAIEAKVLDFGVAKVVSDERRDGTSAVSASPTLVTTPGVIVGTPAYMAPEQFHGTQADARTDIFSLGVIAYEMLSGELPFGRGSLAEVVLAQARGIPVMPPSIVPPAVERAVRAALEMDPDRRPASALAFAHLVQAAVGM